MDGLFCTSRRHWWEQVNNTVIDLHMLNRYVNMIQTNKTKRLYTAVVTGVPKMIILTNCFFSYNDFTGEDVPSDNLRVLVGKHNLKITENTQREYGVSSIIRHGSYNPTSFDFDIALLRLSSLITYNNAVKPVCLPTNDVEPSTNCLTTGWGTTVEGELFKS